MGGPTCRLLPLTGWEEKRAADGRVYYANHATRETTWTRPTVPASYYVPSEVPTVPAYPCELPRIVHLRRPWATCTGGAHVMGSQFTLAIDLCCPLAIELVSPCISLFKYHLQQEMSVTVAPRHTCTSVAMPNMRAFFVYFTLGISSPHSSKVEQTLLGYS